MLYEPIYQPIFCCIRSLKQHDKGVYYLMYEKEGLTPVVDRHTNSTLFTNLTQFR